MLNKIFDYPLHTTVELVDPRTDYNAFYVDLSTVYVHFL